MISFFFSHIQQTVGAAFGENIILKIPLVQVMYKSKGRNEIALSYSIPNIFMGNSSTVCSFIDLYPSIVIFCIIKILFTFSNNNTKVAFLPEYYNFAGCKSLIFHFFYRYLRLQQIYKKNALTTYQTMCQRIFL